MTKKNQQNMPNATFPLTLTHALSRLFGAHGPPKSEGHRCVPPAKPPNATAFAQKASSSTRKCLSAMTRRHGHGVHFNGLGDPVHVFYRFTGQSRHDWTQPPCPPEGECHVPAEQSTPRLGISSFVQALQSMAPQTAALTNVTIMLNGAARASQVHANWLRDVRLRILPHLGSFQVEAGPDGNQQSWEALVHYAMSTIKNGRTVIVQVEEDFWLRPELLSRVVQVFQVHDPCIASLSANAPMWWQQGRGSVSLPVGQLDDADLGRRAGVDARPGKARHAAPLGTMHWSGCSSTTVSYAMRLDVLRDVVRLWGERRLIQPKDDCINSLWLCALGMAVFSPSVDLATHVHRSATRKGGYLTPMPNSTLNAQLRLADSLRVPVLHEHRSWMGRKVYTTSAPPRRRSLA